MESETSSPLLWIWSFSSTAHLVSSKGHLIDLLASLHPSNNQNSARIFLLMDHATFFFFALSPFFFISKIINTCTSSTLTLCAVIFQFPNQQSLGPNSSSGRGEEVLLASLHLRATKPPLRLTHPNLIEDQGDSIVLLLRFQRHSILSYNQNCERRSFSCFYVLMAAYSCA